MADGIRALIESGELQTGEALPSERKLIDILGTSRVTIRKAVDQLIAEGLLERRHGAGTYVAERIEQSGEELTGFTADAKHRGESPTSVWLVRTIAPPTEDEALHLKIGASEKVARLGRVRLSDGEPLAIEHAVVPARFLANPLEVEASLYALLRKYGHSPVSGTQKIRASLATPTEAGLLSISENSEILRIERSTYLADGTPIEFTRSAYRGDRYTFVSDLHRVED
jgi:GntR family transcriptional regulator